MSSTERPFADDQEIYRGEIPSQLAAREDLIELAISRLEAAGCKVDRFFDRLCLDEAITNAIVHGNHQDPKKKVRVRVFYSADRWGFEVADEGAGFDWKSALERAGRVSDSTASSGRGLALILASAAEVTFLDGGTRIIVHKKHA